MINSMMKHSFEDNRNILLSKQKFWNYFNIYIFVVPVYQPWFHSDFFFFFFWVTNVIYQTNAVNYIFAVRRHLFSIDAIFFDDEKHTQWNLATKVKVFHESSICFTKCPYDCISWNTLKEKFCSKSTCYISQFQ